MWEAFGYLLLWWISLVKIWVSPLSEPILLLVNLIIKWYKYLFNTKPKRPPKHRSAPAYYKPGGIIAYKRHPLARLIVLTCLSTSSFPSAHSDRGYDSDSFNIKVDNCCSASMTNSLSDVIGTPRPIQAVVRGYGGHQTPVTHKVTIKWKLEDDTGIIHDIILPNSYYAPNGERLLCPQQWAQVANDHYPVKDGTYSITTSSNIILHWNQRKSKKTVPLDKRINVGIMRAAPGFSRFNAFCSEISECDDEVTACTAHVILDDDPRSATVPSTDLRTDKNESFWSEHKTSIQRHVIPNDDTEETAPTQREDASQINLDEGKTLLLPKEPKVTDDDALLLRWHVRLGHLSFKRLRVLALQGILPKRIIACDNPICLACKFGKATRKPWRTKAEPSRIQPIKITKPGQCVSVDQLQSSTPGFVAQMKGKLTLSRYTGATIFVDHYSRLCYVHPQVSLSAKDTLIAKKNFEAFASSHGVKIAHYHADNGRFAENAWVQDVHKSGQTISYCGVEAHHQNGVAEKTIRDLQDQARTMMLHAQHRWPRAVTHHLWPYALRLANHVRNNTPRELGSPCPLELFIESPVRTNLEHFHTFGCPVFAYEPGTSKWEERARLGMYLGPSPLHSKNVALVLNLTTGLVSPQFHVSYDEHFHTVQDAPQELQSRWTFLAGLSGPDGSPPSLPEPFAPVAAAQPAPVQVTALTPGGSPWSSSTAHTPPTAPDADIPEPESLVAHEALLYPVDGDEDASSAHPLAYVAHRDPDTLYYQQAMKAPDKEQFIQAMKEEVRQHVENKHWKFVLRTDLPNATVILPAVWAMKRKRRISTREVYKSKARLNVHGGKQIQGLHYDETYAPVKGWSTIRLFLILSIIHGWHTRQLDFVLAYPQAAIEKPLFMELPPGIDFKKDKRKYVLQLIKNLYGQKQAGRVWHQYLIKGLKEMNFIQSEHDECLLYRDNLAVLIYVDDIIICCKENSKIDSFILELSKKFKVQEVGDIQDFLGVQVTRNSEGDYVLTQPHLIDSILEELGFHKNPENPPKGKDLPAQTTTILDKDEDGKPFEVTWDYRRVIGKLNFLEKSTRPDLAYAVHQCARFQASPKTSHAKAVKHIARYLLSTRDKGLILHPREPSLECYADADFAGNWKQSTAEHDQTTAQSRTGYVIMFAGCPLMWVSRLQSEIALSTTEAEYIALSTALKDVIPIMNLLHELRDKNFIDEKHLPKVHCKAFEDNSGALEMAKTHKLRPRTKHINIKYHHFRKHVSDGLITIFKIDTMKQLADILTKPLSYSLFSKHRKTLLGWDQDLTRQEGV